MSRLNKKQAGEYHHGDLRQALIGAAFRALRTTRPQDVSLRALGRELRVSPRAPYRHFETKEELLAAVAVEGFRMAEEATRVRLTAAGDDPVARVRAVAEAYVLFAVDHPEAFRVMYAPYSTVQENAAELTRARGSGLEAALAILEEAQRAGRLREGDPMPLALFLWSAAHGLATLLTEGQLTRFDRPASPERVAQLVSSLMLEGLLPRS